MSEDASPAGVSPALAAALADRYRIERALGQGGMATVYLAHDLKHHRKVAVKVLRQELAASLGVERFLREITLTAQLDHPHILPLLDSGTASVQPQPFLYYVMPYVEGESLRNRLDREPQLPLDDALGIAREVADALGYAHERGVIHRDIKPENILLSGGHARVADFGIARAVDAAGSERLTKSGLIVGSALYMSPEQAEGETDPRSDIYALGCVLYEMLVGQPPFSGPTTLSVIARHAMNPVPPLRTIRTDLPAGLEPAILKALAKKAAERYATSREFVAALAPGAAPVAVSAEPARPAPSGSIAVLPFLDLSEKRELEYFCDGMTEELLERLARTPGLRVVSRGSAFAYKGKSLDIRLVGSQLNVGTVLEGSVRTAGDRLRVAVKLTSVADGYQLWAEHYDRTLSDVFAVQDEVAQTVAARLAPRLSGQPERPGAAAPTSNLEAYQLYLKARFFWNKRTEDGFARSIDLLQRAIALDPGFAAAHAALADSHVMLGVYGVLAPDTVMPRAEAAAEQALALQPASAEALSARGCVRAVYRWDWAGAERDFRRAMDSSPGYSAGRQWYAVNLLMTHGRFEEARAILLEAQELDPLSTAVGASLGLLCHLERRYDQAVAQYHQVLELDAASGLTRYFLGQSLLEQRAYAEAIASLERAVELTGGSPETVSALARARAAAGEADEARRLLAMLEAKARERYVSPALFVQVHATLGEMDRAVARLEEAAAVRSAELIWLGVQPQYDRLRSLPQVAAVIRRVGLP